MPPTETPAPESAVSQDGFAQGPAVSPAADLLAWFEGEGDGKTVRIPVVVTPSVLGLASGHIAANASVPESEGLLLKLDDTGMSVGLADRIRNDCPYDKACAIWVEGRWGALIGGPGGLGGMPGGIGGPLGGGPTEHPFAVRDYVGLVEGDATHVLVKQ